MRYFKVLLFLCLSGSKSPWSSIKKYVQFMGLIALKFLIIWSSINLVQAFCDLFCTMYYLIYIFFMCFIEIKQNLKSNEFFFYNKNLTSLGTSSRSKKTFKKYIFYIFTPKIKIYFYTFRIRTLMRSKGPHTKLRLARLWRYREGS